MEISHPRRILAVSRPDSGLLDLVQGKISVISNKHEDILTRNFVTQA